MQYKIIGIIGIVILSSLLSGCAGPDEELQPNTVRDGIVYNAYNLDDGRGRITIFRDYGDSPLSRNYTYTIESPCPKLDFLVIGSYYVFDFCIETVVPGGQEIIYNDLIKIRDENNDTVWYKYA